MGIAEQHDPSFEPSDRIFHYTSAKGLYGILQSECLWATHFQFLNDRKEFTAARDALVEFTSKRLHQKIAAWHANRDIGLQDGETTRSASDWEAKKYVDQFYETSFKNIGESYVLSGFCCGPSHASYQNGGQLHWATYGRSGGYAIRMDPLKLQSLIDRECAQKEACGFITDKVAYSLDELHERFEPQFNKFADVVVKLTEREIFHHSESVDVFSAAAPFHQITGFLKDSFFKNEEEARIVVWRINTDNEEGRRTYSIQMRHNEGLSVPYVELFRGALFSQINPIEAIIVGPHPQNDLRVTALKAYLRSVGLDSISVIKSECPFIG